MSKNGEIVIPLSKVVRTYNSCKFENKVTIRDIKPDFCNFNLSKDKKKSYKEITYFPVLCSEKAFDYNLAHISHNIGDNDMTGFYVKFVGENTKNAELILSYDNNTVYENSECTICLQKINETNKAILQCGHVYHTNCLINHLKTKDTCPICKTKIDDLHVKKYTILSNVWFGLKVALFTISVIVTCPILCPLATSCECCVVEYEETDEVIENVPNPIRNSTENL